MSTSLAVIALVSLSGVASATMQGTLDWSIALPFSAGAAGALLAGRRLARRWSSTALLRNFSILCLLVALLLLGRGLQTLLG